jgi:dolichol-phosphate mannosyltransferase
MHKLEKALVIIPTYNEIENIEDIIAAVLRQGDQFEVLIVDDNSPDGTGKAVQKLKESNTRIHLIERSGKLGLGTAYIAGFQYGLKNNFDYLLEMDADFSHNPDDLTRLLSTCTDLGAKFAIGSRYTKGGAVSNWPKDRLLLSYGASLYVRMITGMPVKDPTAGFICYHNSVLKSFDFNTKRFQGYAFQIEMKYEAYLKGFNFIEVPITFIDRVKGTSKMHSSIVSEAIKGVLNLRIRAIKGYYNKKNTSA